MDEQNQNLEEKNSNIENIVDNTKLENRTSNNSEKASIPNNINQNGENKRNDVGIAIAIFAIILILACGAFVTLRESSGEKFLRMCDDDYWLRIPQNVRSIILRNNKVDFKAEFDIDDFLKNIAGEESNAGKLSLTTSTLRNKNNFLARLVLNLDETELAEAKILLNGTKLGVTMPGLFEQYIAEDLSDIEGVLKSLNLDEDSIKKLKDTIENNAKMVLEAESVADRYTKIFAKNISDKIGTERNAVIKINGKEIKTTKYFFKLETQDIIKLLNEVLEQARDDEELYDLAQKQEGFDYTWEEWQEAIDYLLDDVHSTMNEDYLYEISMQMEVYRRGNDTLAIRIVYMQDDDNLLDINISALNERDNSYIEVKVGLENNYMSFELESEKLDNRLNMNLYLTPDVTSRSKKIKLLNIVVEGENVSKPEFDTIDDSDLMLNSASEEEKRSFVTNVQRKLPSYILKVLAKLPEGLADFIDALSDLNDDANYYDDYDIDYEEDYDYNYGDNYYDEEDSGDYILDDVV